MVDVVVTGGALIAEEIKNDSKDFSFPMLKLQDVDYKEMIGGRGLRYLTDATKMALITANKALENAKLEEISSERSGIVVATNFASIATIIDFDKTIIKDGPRAVGAMQSPNLVLNATAAKLGIHFDITGFNTTVSSGRVGSFDALDYACNMISNGEVDMVIVTGVEEMPEELRNWLVETQNMQEDDVKQFKQFSGTVILESEEYAKSRGAEIYGKIANSAATFNANYLLAQGSKEDDVEEYKYLTTSLLDENVKVDNICLSNNRFVKKEKNEADFVKEAFSDTNIVYVEDMFPGEMIGATGIAQLLYSLDKFNKGKGIIYCNDWTGNFRALLVEK